MATMNCVTVLSICLAISLVLGHYSPLKDNAQGKATRPSSKYANRQKFNPCKITMTISASTRKRLTRLGLSILTSCGLRTIPLMGQNWGPPEKMIMFMPTVKYYVCILFRLVYALFTYSNDRLPARLMRNASDLYNIGIKLTYIFLTDASLPANFCALGKPKITAAEIKYYCYPRPQLLRFMDLVVPCIRGIMKNTAIEHVDAVIYGLNTLFKMAEKHGLLDYMSG